MTFKRYSLMLFVLIIIAGCGKDNSTGPNGNRAPNAPSNPVPAHQATSISLTPEMTWQASDPEGDSLTYDVYFGSQPTPPRASENQSVRSYRPPRLELNTIYYWKVTAKDNHDHTTSGPTWSFTTTVNQAPEVPHSPTPADGVVVERVSTVFLEWQCSDPDSNMDILQYDVYFGTTATPPKADSGLFSAGYDPGVLRYDSDYYWRIIARDGGGHTVNGPLWHFRTGQERITCISRYPFGDGHIKAIAISGQFAFITASYQTGGVFYALNISDPATPVYVDQYGVLNDAIEMEVSGSHAYVAAGNDGLQIISTEHPEQLAWTGEYRFYAGAAALRIIGHYAYVNEWADRTSIIDVSNPSSPLFIGSCDLPQTYLPQDIEVNGSYSYIPMWFDGLLIINNSDPRHPSIAGIYNTQEEARYISVSGSYAYLGYGLSHLEILNVTQPSSPIRIGQYDTDGSLKNITISGQYAFLPLSSRSGRCLEVVDISNPSAPVWYAEYIDSAAITATAVTVSGEYIYLGTDQQGLLILHLNSN